jgi:hypothetical protein
MERLILDEQTTPNESFEAGLKFSAGATPGGVTGLGRRVGIVIVGPYYTTRTSDGSSAAACWRAAILLCSVTSVQSHFARGRAWIMGELMTISSQEAVTMAGVAPPVMYFATM